VRGRCQRLLAADCVAAGFTASAAVPKTVGAESNVQLTLTENAVLFALAALFDLIALAAADFDFGSAHGANSIAAGKTGKVPLVTGGRFRAMGFRRWALAKSSTLGAEGFNQPPAAKR